MTPPDKSCILFFVKYPEQGQVKTRLSAELGASVTVELYRSFVLDVLSMLEKSGIQFYICFSPENSQEKFVKWLGNEYSYMPQQGGDLGQRMKNALCQSFAQGFRHSVLIGSDIPDLSAELMEEACSSLRTHDAVIGPSLDGGYYLIGFNNSTLLPGIFKEMEWSTDTVFAETLTRLKDAKLKVHQLPERRDIDILADLRSLYLGSRNNAFSRSRTMSCIFRNHQLRARLEL